jgi:hypothetical protein
VGELDSTLRGWRSAALMLTLGSLGIAAAMNWQPLALLVDTVIHWPNIAMALIQVALITSTAGICVLMTTVASGHNSADFQRHAIAQYCIAAAIATASIAVFLVAGERLEMPPAQYLERNLVSTWSLPLVLYLPLALTAVAWTALRHSTR